MNCSTPGFPVHHQLPELAQTHIHSLSLFSFMHWRRKWQPIPMFLPGESQGREPGRLLSMGSHRIGHDWCKLAASAAYPLSRWCHPTISSSVVPFSSLLQSFPASGSFPMSCLFTSGDQSIGVSASASVLPMNPSNEHSGQISLRMDWLDLFAVQGTLKSLLQHHSSKASVL